MWERLVWAPGPEGHRSVSYGVWLLGQGAGAPGHPLGSPPAPGWGRTPRASPQRARLQAVSEQLPWGVGPGCRTEGEEMPPRRWGGRILVKGRVLGRSFLGLVSGDGGQGKRQALKAGGLRLFSSDSKTRGAVTPAGSLGQGRVLGLSHTPPPRGVLPPGRLRPAGTLTQSPGFTECSEPLFQVRILLYKCGN